MENLRENMTFAKQAETYNNPASDVLVQSDVGSISVHLSVKECIHLTIISYTILEMTPVPRKQLSHARQ